MFIVDTNITELKLREKNLFKAFFSMNNHQVATPEMMLEEARSYTLFYRESTGKISAYIGMYLLSTGRKIFYAHDSNPFPEDKMSAVEEEALGFAEGLGAMLDQVDLSNMSDEEKRRWIDSQDIFALKVDEPIAVEVAAAPATPEPAPEVAPASSPAPVAPVMAAPQEQPVMPPEVIAAPQTQVPASAVVAASPQPPVAPAVAAPAPQAQQPAVSAAPAEDRIPQALPQADTEVQQVQRVAEVPSLPKKNKAPARSKPDAASLNEQDIMEQAIKAGIVKSSNLLKKDTRSAAGVVGRDKEALARLLTSF